MSRTGPGSLEAIDGSGAAVPDTVDLSGTTRSWYSLGLRRMSGKLIQTGLSVAHVAGTSSIA